MEYTELLDRIIDDGIAAAKADYAEDPMKEEGSVEGFEACRGKEPQELMVLLAQAHVDTHVAMIGNDNDYWRIRCYEAEIEWVCNCVSVTLWGEGKPVIVPPTAGAVMKVASVLSEAEAI